jgi:putative permease
VQSDGLTFRDLRNAILFAALVYAAIAFARHVTNILLVLSIAILIVVVLSPTVTWLSRRGIPRWAGALAIVLGFLGLAGLAGYLITPVVVVQATQLAAELPALFSKLETFLARLFASASGLSGSAPKLDLQTITQISRPLLGGLAQITTGTAQILVGAVVVFITTIYTLISPGPLVNGFLGSLRAEDRPRAAAAGERVALQIHAWAKGTAIAMAAIFALTWPVLSLLGFKQALLFAAIAGVLELVPVIGPIASAVPPVLVALVTEPIRALWVIAAFVVIQQVESHLLIPIVMSRQVNLHPVTVLFWVLVMGTLFGIIGVFIATPTAVVAGVLYDELYLREYRRGCDQEPGGSDGQPEADEQEGG